MSGSEESDESENSSDCIEIKAKQMKFNPNVLQFTPHFTPGTAFNHNSNVIRNNTFVRKRSNYLIQSNASQISSNQSIVSNDSNEKIVDSIDDNSNDEDWRNGPAKYWYDFI